MYKPIGGALELQKIVKEFFQTAVWSKRCLGS